MESRDIIAGGRLPLCDIDSSTLYHYNDIPDIFDI